MKYRNPVIPGFHPDPSICRVGQDYFLATSSFEYFPGVPLFHSRDLVNWRQIGHALARDSQLPLENTPGGVAGIFAPTLRHHAGRFFMVTTNVSTKWNFLVTADDPAGEWSAPVLIDRQGYDPSLFFDDDGSAYYTRWADGDVIGQARIDIRTGKLLEPVRPVWSGSGGACPEGPHLYKIRGRYYLMAAEGGTHIGHLESIARADRPDGPFENCPHNPILTHRRSLLYPIQAAGHGDLVEDHTGQWWMVFLGFRPRLRQFFPFHHLGRETFLAPVEWDADGWPVVNAGRPVGLEVEAGGLAEHPWPAEPARDDFDHPPLRPCWNFLRNPRREDYSLAERPGFLRLWGSEVSLDAGGSPTFVGRRQQHFRCRAATLLDFSPSADGDEAGLTVLANESHYYVLAVTRQYEKRCVIVGRRMGDLYVEIDWHELPADGAVLLEVRADEDNYTFLAGPAGQPLVELATAPTRYLCTEVVGGFTGVFIGMYAAGPGRRSTSPADFDWFEYHA